MRKLQLLFWGIVIAGTIAGCGNKAESAETTNEVITDSESEADATTETTSESALQEETVDDKTYNIQLLVSLGINDNDSQKVAMYLEQIYFGKIEYSERMNVSANCYIQLNNKDENILFLYMSTEDSVKEILDANLNLLSTISSEDTSNQTSIPSESVNGGSEEQSGNSNGNQSADNSNAQQSSQGAGTDKASNADSNSQSDDQDSGVVYGMGFIEAPDCPYELHGPSFSTGFFCNCQNVPEELDGYAMDVDHGQDEQGNFVSLDVVYQWYEEHYPGSTTPSENNTIGWNRSRCDWMFR